MQLELEEGELVEDRRLENREGEEGGRGGRLGRTVTDILMMVVVVMN